MQNTAVAFTAQDPSTVAPLRILETRPASPNPSQEGLPSIVVLEIFQYLDLHSLLKCRLVCSGFQYLIDSTANLQYKIELAVAGQQDGGYGDMFTRREMLKIHQKRWDGLQWTEVLRMPMLNHWELCGGVFAQASSKPYTLHLKRIPSQSRRIKEKNWILDLSTLLGEEARMGDFGMDPSQDLLVIIAIAGKSFLITHCIYQSFNTGDGLRLHLLTLSKGERHPLTSEPCFVPQDLGWERSQWFNIDICHHFLNIRSVGGAVLWNWKTGQVHMHIINDGITSMVFLNERYVLMAVMRAAQFYLLAIDFLAGSPEQHDLYELENCFIFRFPYTSPPPLDDINLQSNPRSTWGADTNPSVPFSMVPKNRLFLVYLISSNIGEDLCFAILEASFLSLIKTGLRVNNNSFDWSMWGPEHSRALPVYSHSLTWLFPSHGTRFAMKRHLPHRGIVVDIYDFNQLACRNKMQGDDVETPGNVNVSESSEVIEGRPVCVLGPTRIKVNMFHSQVETRLGYSVTSWSVPGSGKTHARSISVMCSEDAVIIVDETNEMYEIYTV